MLFQFAIFYLTNKAVKVESTAIILDKADELHQRTSKPNLEDYDNWIEIKCPTRKEPEKTMPAIVLLFGETYQELVTKKGLFMQGKDIWSEEESRSVRMKKTRETEVLQSKKAVPAKQAKIKENARNHALWNLKTSLSQKRLLETSSEDESPQVNPPQQAARRLLLANASSPSHDSFDDTYIESPQRLDMIQDPDFAEEVGFTSTPKTMDDNTHSMNDIMASLRELPEMIRQMKECVHYVRAMMPSTSGIPSSEMSSSSSSFSMASDETHTLAGSTVKVSKRAFLRLNRSRMTLFCQELAALVFSKEVLATSTLTGKSGKAGPLKIQLDVVKVQAITDAVMTEFTETSASDVRAVIRRKCNNEQFNQRKYSCM